MVCWIFTAREGRGEARESGSPIVQQKRALVFGMMLVAGYLLFDLVGRAPLFFYYDRQCKESCSPLVQLRCFSDR